LSPQIDDAVLAYLDMREKGHAPPPEEFARRYPDVEKELLARIMALSTAFGVLKPSFLPPETGQRIGGYSILREIGRGSMGVVFLAERPDDFEPRAMKFLPGLYTANERTRHRFLREADTLKRLNHPNVVGVHEVGELAGSPYFIMDYVAGKSLDRIIESWRTGQDDLIARDPGAIARLFAGLARGLAHVHGHGVIHRDIKPSNILVAEDGTARLGDFGLARDETATSLTATGGFLGTPYYCAPEQIRGSSKGAGPLSDIYSLGVSLYETLSLRVPFEGHNAEEIFIKIRKGFAPPLRRVRADLPPELAAVVHKAIDQKPERRFADAAALAGDLEKFAAGQRTATRPPGTASIVSQWVSRNRWLPILLAVAVLVVLGLRIGYTALLDFRFGEFMSRTDNTMLLTRPEYVTSMDEAWDLADTDAERYRVLARKLALMGGGVERDRSMVLDASSPAVEVRRRAADLLAQQTTLAMPDIGPLLQMEPFFLSSAVICEKNARSRPEIIYRGHEYPERCVLSLGRQAESIRAAAFRDGEYIATQIAYDAEKEAGIEVKQTHCADLDADGRIDLVMLVEKTPLFRLEGALARGSGADEVEFVRVIDIPLDESRPPLCITSGDYDCDGDVDLFIAADALPGSTRSHYLFLNEKDAAGRLALVDASESAGLSFTNESNLCFRSMGVAWIDLDEDGDLDLLNGGTYLAGSTPLQGVASTLSLLPPAPSLPRDGEGVARAAPFVLRNDTDREGGRPLFTDITRSSDIKLRTSGEYCSKVAAGDVNGDGTVDILLGTIPPMLYVSGPDGGHENVWSGAKRPVKSKVVASLALFDFDLDGDLDIYVGYLSARDQLLINKGVRDGIPFFDDRAAALGIVDETEMENSVSWGTWLDVDLDGDLDLLARRIPGFDRVYRNDVARGRWLRVFFDGPPGDRFAHGARVVVRSGTKTWIRYHGAHHAGYVRQMRSVHFGLGSADRYDSIEVIWPAGKSTLLPGGRLNRTLTVSYDGE